jgi:hypothetical protein
MRNRRVPSILVASAVLASCLLLSTASAEAQAPDSTPTAPISGTVSVVPAESEGAEPGSC